MPDKRPPNAEATQFQSGEEAVENGRKGGIASGQARREKKTIQNVLQALCDSKCTDIPQFKKIADKIGFDTDKSVKELFALVSTLNTLKNAKMDDLAKMAGLLGEQTEREDEKDIAKVEKLLEEMRPNENNVMD